MDKSTGLSAAKLPLVSFVNEAYLELKKVTWPTRQQVIRLTTIVVVASLITGAYLGLLDYVFTWLLGLLLNRPEISQTPPLPLGN